MKIVTVTLASIVLFVAATASAQPPGSSNQNTDAYEVIERLAQAVVAAQAPRRQLPGQQTPAPEPDRPTVDLFALLERLSDEMDKEFVVPPFVSARSLGWTTLDGDADFETLQGLLRASQLGIIETADQIFIVQEATSRAEPSPILNEDDRRVSDHAFVTRVIEVENVPTAQLIPILRPMLPQAAQITAVQGTTSLIVVDRYDNVRRITEIVRAIDAAAEN